MRLFTFTIFAVAIWISPLQSAIISRGGRIIGGEEAEEGQFPWQVALYIDDDVEFCGGVLISKEWILTSAYCADNRTSFVAVLGVTNLANAVVGYHISKAVVHEDYVSDLTHNVALLKLAEPIEITDNISPVMLAGDTLNEDVDVIVSGFGKVIDSDFEISDILHWVNVSTITRKDCASYYNGIKDEHVCTLTHSGTPQGICGGDQGGPAVTYVGKRPLLVAISIARSGYGCELGYPSIFTRIKPYLEWIALKINSE